MSLHPADRLIGEILGQVVARAFRRGDEGLVLHERRRELVNLRRQEAVEMIEALTQRPAVVGTGGRAFPLRCEMPLAEGCGAVTVLPQDLGERRRALRQHAVVARVGGRRIEHRTDTHGVRIAASQQRGTGRRADRAGMEAVVAQALVGEPLEGRCLDRAAKGAGGGKADVIEQHDHHIWCTARCRLQRHRQLRIFAGQHRAGDGLLERRRWQHLCRGDGGAEGEQRGGEQHACPSKESVHFPAPGLPSDDGGT